MRWFLAVLLCICALIGCKESGLTSSGSQNTLTSATYYLSADTKVRVFEIQSSDVGGLGTFVTDLSAVSGVVQIPSTLTQANYGTRTDPSVPQTLDLIIKAYNANHPSGDFLFEAPLLSPDVNVTNVTTAVLWLLRWGYNSPSLKISQNSFNSIVTSIELICSNCRTKTNSQVLNLIQETTFLMEKIQSILENENPGLSLSYSWNPSFYYAYSSPVLSVQGYGAQTSKQLDTVTAKVLLVHPEHSTDIVRPASWLLTRADSSTAALDGGDLTYTFTNEDQVSADFKPTFNNSTLGSGIVVHYEVARANRAPVCAEPMVLQMKANRMNTVALTDYCYDPDNPTTTPNLGVSYALISGPSGLTITSGGVLKWSPANSLSGSSYAFQVLVTSSTSASHTAQGTVTVNQVAIPTFTSVPTGITMSEGSQSIIPINVSNSAEDPLKLIVTGVTPIQSGYPAGAGILNSYTTTGTSAAPEFDWAFTPSYLQTIGANGNFTLRFSLKYNTSVDPTLDGAVTLATMDVTFALNNADDPPVWDESPQSFDLTEGQAFNIPVGKAHDPNPNPTTLTYSFQSSDGQCDWSDTASINVDGTGNVFLTGYPNYTSRDTCSFQIIAKDANNLASSSSSVTYNVTNSNRPVTELAGVTEVDGYENKSLILPISDMFTDDDITDSDPRENLTWLCYVNTDGSSNYTDLCSSLNINFILSNTSFSGNWYAPYGSAGTYYIKLVVTDIGGSTASHIFKMVITPSPAPMLLSLMQNGIETMMLSGSEGTTSAFTLQVRSQSTAEVNQYEYFVSNPTCSVSSGTAKSCRVGMINSPSSMSAIGDQDFGFFLNPNYTDGDAPLPGTSATYLVTFTVTNALDSTVSTTLTTALTINNTDRAPTGIGLSTGTQGCTGSAAGSGTSSFTICIDLSKNSKSGATWTKNYSMTLSYVDADGTNDSYSYSLSSTVAPGTISGNTWTIKLPSCLYSGTSTVTRNYSLILSDGRGGTVARPIIINIKNGFAASNCM